jgi:hypothetical protein
METPFFSNRICVGNAVVGAWLKVYTEKDIIEEYEVVKDAKGKQKRVLVKKEWWDKAPRQLEFKPQLDYNKIKHGRKKDEIYHFLLPDKNMVASVGIKLLKAENEKENAKVAQWKRDWIKPVDKDELKKLNAISNKIDELLTEYYRFQRSINLQTSTKQNIFGVTTKQVAAELKSYDEKEKLADQRNRHSAPYFKLKMVMDYWCSLWFWDMRKAFDLPSREQFWNDITNILDLDTNKALDGMIEKKGQQQLFETATQFSLAIDVNTQTDGADQETGNKANDDSELFISAVVEYTNRANLFDNNQRLQMVSDLAAKYFFFHPQLEFLEVFWERGGFDLIAGNPPWLKLQFEEKTVIAEKFPEIEIRNVSAPAIRQIQSKFFEDDRLKEIYYDDMIGTECTSVFLNAGQNYPLLVGQQTNLYKCVYKTDLVY